MAGIIQTGDLEYNSFDVKGISQISYENNDIASVYILNESTNQPELIWSKTSPVYVVFLDNSLNLVQKYQSILCFAEPTYEYTNNGTITYWCTGWKERGDSLNTVIVQNNDYYSPTASIALQSIYAIKYFQATFNANGGTVSQNELTADQYGKITLPTATHSGTVFPRGTVYYTFDGWYTGQYSGSRVGGEGSQITLTQDTPLYAHWSQITYDVTLNFNGSGASQQTLTTNADGEVTLPQPVRADYDFQGWYDSSSGGNLISTGGQYFPTTDKTLYAHWQSTKVYYTVTFDNSYPWYGTTDNLYKNKSSDNTYTSCSPMTVEAGQSLYMPTPAAAPAQSRSGTNLTWIFKGWYTAPSNFMGEINSSTGRYTPTSSGTFVKNADASYTPSGNITVYGRWQLNQYAINIYYGDNSSVTLMTDYDNQVNLPNPTRSGYTFNGWYTGATSGYGSLITTQASGWYTFESGQSIHAEYTAATYTITFDANGGSSVSSRTVSQGSAIGTLPTTSRSYYTFNGWKVNGTTITSSFVPTGDCTAIADWSLTMQAPVISYITSGGKVTWNAVSGAVSYRLGKLQEDGEWVYTSKTTNTQYTFGNLIPTYGVAVKLEAYDGGDNVTSTIQYIDWCTLTFNGNSGSPSTATRYIISGHPFSEISPPTVTRSNYTFNNWRIDSTSGTTVTSSTTFTTDKTLYATWTANTVYYTITLDTTTNGGTGGGSYSRESGTTFNLSSYSASKSSYTSSGYRYSYTFKGWYTASSGGTKTTSITVTQDKTYYAQFTESSSLILQAPTGVSVSGKTVSWNAATGATKYKVYKNGNTASTAEGNTYSGSYTTSTSYTFGSSANMYKVWVVAYDDYGNEKSSSYVYP